MKKIMLSLAVIAIVAVGAIGATRAYFSSTSSSTGNTFTTGTMELKLGSATQDYATSGITFATASNLAPGVVSPAYNLYFKNGGSIEGKVKLAISYSAIGGTNADAFATKMVVKEAFLDDYTGVNVASRWADQIISKGGLVANGDVVVDGTGFLPTVYGLSKISVYFRAPNTTADMPWAPGDTHHTTLKLMLDSSADNNYQNKGINIIVNGTMNQAGDSVNW